MDANGLHAGVQAPVRPDSDRTDARRGRGPSTPCVPGTELPTGERTKAVFAAGSAPTPNSEHLSHRRRTPTAGGTSHAEVVRDTSKQSTASFAARMN